MTSNTSFPNKSALISLKVSEQNFAQFAQLLHEADFRLIISKRFFQEIHVQTEILRRERKASDSSFGGVFQLIGLLMC
ncbi:hypothetical protein CEXT_535971 [Caerostris extrusa]|uniref:Uncharacterized protein n=1 Tax=Caerostris extrusa TaxID=172846 RepID=A0AAV4QIJ2_CAEEX|nr:hypothetical protein CEXT_535971 [Caerostris extrusa]